MVSHLQHNKNAENQWIIDTRVLGQCISLSRPNYVKMTISTSIPSIYCGTQYRLFMASCIRLNSLCPHSIRSILLKNLLKTRFSARFLTCYEQFSDMSQTSQRLKKSSTCRRPDRSISTCREWSSRSAICQQLFCWKRVLSKIEAVEYRKRQVRRFFCGTQPIGNHAAMT